MDILTADLVDAHEPILQSCDVQFRQYGGRLRFHGPVRTIRTFEDNPIIKRVLSTPGEGAVLVVDGAGSLRTSLLGDFIGGLGEKSGWAGVIIWGAVRDVVGLGQLNLGIKALGSNPLRSRKNGTGEVDVPISFGSVTFRPGNWLYSDEDGIVVSERELALPERSTPTTDAQRHR